MARTRRTSRDDDERAEYERLRAKYERPEPRRRSSRRERDDSEPDDDSPILMFSGRRAQDLLDRMFGDSAPSVDDDDEDDDDQDDEDDDDQDDEDDSDDPEPPSGHGFFRGRRGRG